MSEIIPDNAKPCFYCMIETWHSKEGICAGISTTCPLLQCTTCGHKQTFSSELVSVVMSEGYCDQCKAQRYWSDVNEINL